MPRPKSIIRRVQIDEVQRAHNCQHNKNHRLQRGDKRLTVWNQRSAEHYCVLCGLEIIRRDIDKLHMLALQLRNDQPMDRGMGQRSRGSSRAEDSLFLSDLSQESHTSGR